MMNGIGNMKMCKSESALKTLLPEKRIKRQASGAERGCSKGSNGIATQSNVDDKRKMEKAENIMHLICWGPTWS